VSFSRELVPFNETSCEKLESSFKGAKGEYIIPKILEKDPLEYFNMDLK